MSVYDPKNELVLNRALKVQTLYIPFVVVGSATPASVSLTNDEPAILFMNSAGVTQISTATGALATNETATFTTAAADATGVLQALVKVQEPVVKVVSAFICGRASGLLEPAFLGSATGITTGTDGGKSIMLAIDSATALNAANTLNATLVVSYQV